jgi:hypothetical protein
MSMTWRGVLAPINNASPNGEMKLPRSRNFSINVV